MPRLATREWGSGVPAVLVHGSLTTGEENWHGQRPLAEKGFRLVVPDRRGYGDSPKVAGEDFLRDGEDVAELLGDGAHLVGHSYGAVAALVAADRRPDAVRSLTLIEPPAFALRPDHPAVASFVAEARDLWARSELTDREFLEAFLRMVGAATEEIPAEMLDAWTDRVSVVRHGRAPWDGDDSLGRAASGRFPTLVLSGDHHPAFDAVCEELTRRLGARSTVIRGAGHEVQMMSEPCNRALLEVWGGV